MTALPDNDRLFATLEATWPAATRVKAGPWIFRQGLGGGNRVSATTQEAAFTEDDLIAAEGTMATMDQKPVFVIRPGEEALDAALDARGYGAFDHSVTMAGPISALTDQPVPRLTAFALWEPLAITREIWETDGIGAARQQVMDRAKGPKTAILGRIEDTPAGAAYVAMHEDIAMIHAVCVLPQFRRKGLARHMMRAAGHWAADNGARWLSLQVLASNDGARALYEGLQMRVCGAYHYRRRPDRP